MKKLFLLLAVLLVVSFSAGAAQERAGETQEPARAGASKACSGCSLGTVNGCPACMKSGKLHLCKNNFPDSVFRNQLAAYDTDGDGSFTVAERNYVTNFSPTGENYNPMKSLNGIEFFDRLSVLYVSFNELTSLDISHNTNLEQLYCYNNQLSSLDVSKNVLLRVLQCGSNQLSSLDVSRLSSLERLDCVNNQIEKLNVGGLTKLYDLSCGMNLIRTLDVSKLTNLQFLNCSENQIRTLDVSGLTQLWYLSCSENQIRTLDVSGLTALRTLHCNDNQIATLNVSKLKALEDLFCSGNQIRTLDVSGLTALKYLLCSFNQIRSLDVSKLTALENLYCFNNQIRNLEVGKLKALKILSCGDNQISRLDVSGLAKLEILYCSNNQLSSLDVRGVTKLTALQCQENKLKTLYLGSHTGLKEVTCEGPYNRISGLDISGCPKLIKAYTEGSHQLIDLESYQFHEYLWGSERWDPKGFLSVNKDTKISTTPLAFVSGVSLTIGGRIDANIFLTVPKAAQKAVVTYSNAGSIVPARQTFTFSQMQKDAQGYYKLVVENIPAKEMTETISVAVYDGNNTKLALAQEAGCGKIKTNSYQLKVVDYANMLIDHPETYAAKYQNIAKAILNYGEKAQLQFKHRTDDLANPKAYLKSEMSKVKANAAYDLVLPSGYKKTGFKGLALNLEGAMDIYLFFDHKVTAVNEKGTAYKVEKSGTLYRVVIPGVVARELHKIHTVIIKEGGTNYSFKVCGLSYANQMMGKTDTSATLLNVCKALYLYNKYAIAAFE